MSEPKVEYAYQGGRRYVVHPTRTCGYCGGRLMFGNPLKKEWHCAVLSQKAPDFLTHYEASQLFQPLDSALKGAQR